MKSSFFKRFRSTIWMLLALLVIYYLSYLMLKTTNGPRSIKTVIPMMFLIMVFSYFRFSYWCFLVPMVFIYALFAPFGITYGPFNYEFFSWIFSLNKQEVLSALQQIPKKHYLYSFIIVFFLFLYSFIVKKLNKPLIENKFLLLGFTVYVLSFLSPAIFPKNLLGSALKVKKDHIYIQDINQKYNTQFTVKNLYREMEAPDEIIKELEKLGLTVAVHRVNIVEKLKEVLALGVNNIEIDIFVEDGQLLVGHEKATFSGYTLREYLQKVHEINPGFDFIWLDLKDLTKKNEEIIYKELVELDSIYDLKSRVFVESRYIDALEIFSQQGWSTGYYLRYNLSAQNKDYVDKVIKDLNTFKVPAITFDCKHIDFAEKHFGDISLKNGENISLNCWTFKRSNYGYKDFLRFKNIDRLLFSVRTKNNL